MPIARIFEGKSWTASQYDELIERMELGGRSAPGVLFHWAAETPDGIVAIDVYDSQEVADQLAADKVGPIVAEIGLTPPVVTQHDVHRILSP